LLYRFFQILQYACNQQWFWNQGFWQVPLNSSWAFGQSLFRCVPFRSFFFVLSEKDAHQLLGYLVGYPICLESRASWRIRLSRSDSDMELCRKISSASTQ
jgi:hypothetical protein